MKKNLKLESTSNGAGLGNVTKARSNLAGGSSAATEGKGKRRGAAVVVADGVGKTVVSSPSDGEIAEDEDVLRLSEPAPEQVEVLRNFLDGCDFSYDEYSGTAQITLKRFFCRRLVHFLRHIPTITSVSFEDGDIVDAAVLYELSHHPVNYLTIGKHGEHSKLADNVLKYLARLEELMTLRLHCFSQITDAGLVHLKEVQHLWTLELHCPPQITDAGLAHLKDVKYLENLFIHLSPQNTGEGIAQLMQLPRIDRLHVHIPYESGVTGEGCEMYRYVPRLWELSLAADWSVNGIVELMPWLDKLPYLDNLCLRFPDDILFPENMASLLKQKYGEPTKARNDGGLEWESIRARQEIIAYMQKVRKPIYRHDVRICSNDNCIVRAFEILCEQGVVDMIPTAAGTPKYRLKNVPPLMWSRVRNGT